MAYTPTTWNRGDTVTSTKLNKLEQGVANAGNGLIITDTNGTLDKTFAEIYDALADGVPCFVKFKDISPSSLDEEYVYSIVVAPVLKLHKYDSMYRIYIANNTTSAVGNYYAAGTPSLWVYSATSSQSYPTYYRTVYITSTGTAISTSNYQ